MADVTMNYGSLENAASQVSQAQEDLEQVISFLTNAVSALEGNWQGESYNAFVNAWAESKPTMEKLAAAVGNFAPELKRAVASQKETETANAGAMAALGF